MTHKVASVIDTTLSSLVHQSSEVYEGRKVIDFSAHAILRYLQRIEDIVLTVGESQGELFSNDAKTVRGFTLWQLKGTSVGRKVLTALQYSDCWEHIKNDIDHEFSQEVRLWMALREQYLPDPVSRDDFLNPHKETLDDLLRRLQALVDAIRLEVNREGFRDWQQRRTKLTKKNTASAQRWLDHIFQRYASLLVIRIDLAYQKDFQQQERSLHAVTITEAFKHRERFLRALPKWIPQGALLGYCVKTEYTLRRSIHHHCLIIVDGSKISAHLYWAKVLGTKWAQDITQGRGDYFNVNATRDSRDPDSGIGRVSVNDTAKVFNLRHRVLPYLVKPDFLVRWVVPKKHRLFLKSIARPLTGTKPGRPRTARKFQNESTSQ